tara:strand:- start:178 stop:1341 length:1164 start_codon:yes stop_codon:yes gene_type:complete
MELSVHIENKIKKSLNTVNSNIESSKGLPNKFYTSEEIFEYEKETVFSDNWCGIAFGSDIPDVGDIKALEFLSIPLIVVRTEKEHIQVFENVCRHRGMILVEESVKKKKHIRCPYHNWCYGIDGKLLSTPHVGGIGNHNHEDIKKNDLGLNKIRSHIWNDTIFINISGDASSFDDHFSRLKKRWSDFDQPMFFGGYDSEFSMCLNANWKLAIENYCESYHLPSVHPELNKTSKLSDHYHICESENYSGQGSLLYNQISDKSDVFPDFMDLADQWNNGTEYVALYPNVLMGVHRDQIFSVIVNPLSVTKITERAAFYFSEKLEQRKSMKKLLIKNKNFWKNIFEEDIYVVEGMQKGRNTRMFDGGVFSPSMEIPTHNFHKWIARALLS